MGSSDFVTLFFLVAAVLIFLQLRSVLGRRTGNEKPPFDPFSARDKAGNPDASADNGKVVTLPRREPGEAGEDAFAPIDAVAPAGSALNAIGGRQAALGLAPAGSEEVAVGIQEEVTVTIVRERPRPLAARVSVAEAEAHAALVAKLGDKALWKQYS